MRRRFLLIIVIEITTNGSCQLYASLVAERNANVGAANWHEGTELSRSERRVETKENGLRKRFLLTGPKFLVSSAAVCTR